MVKSYQDLSVWQRSIQLSVLIYQLTKTFPREETYGLTSQMRRCAVSIPSNIAEGAGRLNTAEYKQFLGIAKGSNFELQTQLVIARELGYGQADQIARAEAICTEVGKMIHATIVSLHNRTEQSRAEKANQPLATSH